MAKERDRWLSREMGGEAGRGVAKLVAGLRQLIGFKSRHFSKKQNGRHKPTRSSLPKNIQINIGSQKNIPWVKKLFCFLW
jgi:hypothetical protein